jgi:hypothetical protein
VDGLDYFVDPWDRRDGQANRMKFLDMFESGRYPSTWRLIGPDDDEYEKNDEFLTFERPVTHQATLEKLGPASSGHFASIGSQKFYGSAAGWMERFRKRNPTYVHPPVHIVLYGARNAFLRFPPKLNWRGEMLPAINRLCRTFGVQLKSRDDHRYANVEGCDAETWEKNNAYSAYDYINGQWKLIKTGRHT